MITDTLTFLSYASSFVAAGVSKLDMGNWKGPLILALLLGEFAVSLIFRLAQISKPKKKGGEYR